MCVKGRNKIREAANKTVTDALGLHGARLDAFNTGAKHGELMAGLFLQKAVEVLRDEVHQMSMALEAAGGESLENNLVSLNTMAACAGQQVGEALFIIFGDTTLDDAALRGLNVLEQIHELEPTTRKPKSAQPAHN